MNAADYILEVKTVRRAEPNMHQGIECILVLRGSLDIAIEGENFCLHEEDLVVINRNQMHAIQGNANNLALAMTVGADRLREACGELAENRLACNGAAQDMAGDGAYFELKRILVHMFKVKLDKAYGYTLNLDMNLLRVLFLLYTNYSIREPSFARTPHPAGESTAQRTILEYIHQNYHRPITLKEMAGHFHLSPAHFSRHFKNVVGMGYFQYLQRIRVEKSMYRLLHSKDSIQQISIDCGFPNPKAYSENFMRQYGESPSRYRASHRAQPPSGTPLEDAQLFTEDLSADDARLAFLAYVREYEAFDVSGRPIDENHVVDVHGPPLRILRRMDNILLIDRHQEVLRKDFDMCLDFKDRFNIKYVYFQLLDYHLPEAEYGYVLRRQLLLSVRQLHQYGLAPFIRLDFSKTPFTGSDEEIFTHLHEKVRPFLQVLAMQFSDDITRTWRFEIVCSGFDGQQAQLFYRLTWQMVSEFFPAAPIGLFAEPDADGQIGARFEQMLAYAKQLGMPPSFVTYHAFQNSLKRGTAPDALLYEGGESFFSDTASSVLLACRRQNLRVPMFMTVWNTFTGSNLSEIKTYVRTALIMEALMDMYNTVQGLSFRFAERNSCPYSGECYGAPLDLFIFTRARRPLYYVARMANRLCGAVLYQSHRVAVSKNGSGELVLTVWNPQYLNPARCLDSSIENDLTQQIRVELRGLEDRKYLIKRFTIDSDSSGSLTGLNRSGYPSTNDKDAFEYMENLSGGDLLFFTQVADGGTLMLTSNVQYNGVVMYVIT